jgi:hypothetical protein
MKFAVLALVNGPKPQRIDIVNNELVLLIDNSSKLITWSQNHEKKEMPISLIL